MIQSLVKLEKYLNYLLIFLPPTQLALHFWLPSSFVFGIRIDYLAPTIYLTDILFLSLFMVWVKGGYKRFFEFLNKNRVCLFLIILLAFVNIVFSTSIIPSIYKWLKIGELVLFYFYLRERKDIFSSKTLLSVLYYSLIFFSIIGISQFVLGRTLGGPLYFLGERAFNVSTPGIALVDIFGKNYMRAYSTFSHPNSLAGYLGLGLIAILFLFSKKELFKRGLGITVISLAFLLTFSLSAFIALVLSASVYLLLRKKVINKKLLLFVPAVFLLISLSLPFISSVVLNNKVDLPQNLSQRVYLSSAAGVMISQKFLTGTGLNTFIVNEPKIKFLNNYQWIMQPVHNIFLLVFSEVGVFGLIIVYILLIKLNREAINLDNKIFYIGLVFILITGLTDHYWFTLQQNMFLIVVIFSNFFRKEG